MTKTVRFDAEDLWSKWGFSDGDVLSSIEYAEIGLTDEQHDKLMKNDPLENIVRRYLVPEIERVTGKPCVVSPAWGTAHNPMRHEDYGKVTASPEMENIHVKLTLEQIMECCK